MKQKYLLILLFITCYFVRANIITVPGSYATIQAAINASVNGDTIRVEQGTYMENINFRGKKIVLTSRYYLTNNTSTIYATIINGSAPVNADTGSCVIFNHNEDSTTVLQGFYITGGSGTKWQDEHGAGLYREGGGILVQYSNPVVQFNIISGNIVTNTSGVISTGGGGIRIGDSFVRFYDNIVMNNTGLYGAGVVLNYTGGEYKNNIVCVNYGSSQYGAGSGLWLNGFFNRPITIENNTVVSNSATNGTGGIYGAGISATLRNNIIWGNTSPLGVQINGNSLTVRYCDVQGGFTGAGNLNVNPQFADSNYILLNTSPCIDRGDSSVIYNDIEDPNSSGNALYPSKGTIRNDIGAYGGPKAKVLSNNLIGIHPIGSYIPDDFLLEQNYPNPFNPSTEINFQLSANSFVSLKVYDSNGKEISTLVNENLYAGNYKIEFKGNELSSGIYFYRIVTGNHSETKKMILVK